MSEQPDLGPCCICGGTDAVNAIVMLDRRSPSPGKGWGCVVCGLPADGAYAVICDTCLPGWQDGKTEIVNVCRGYPGTDGRMPLAELAPGKFEHRDIDHG